jgi:predicted DCC family thiol-disulfide oxidoreductase YuxK
MFPQTAAVFPNILNWAGTPIGVQAVMCVLAAVSLGYILGFQRRIMALLLWYGWTCLINHRSGFSLPHEGYVGWLLLASVLIPDGEPWALAKRNSQWEMPREIFYGAWVIVALSYSYSGFDKWTGTSWRNGDAMFFVLDDPREHLSWVISLNHALPRWVTAGMTWFVLWVELLYAPLCLWSRGRFWAWLVMVFMHGNVLWLLDIGNVSWAMLVTHFFLFDARWFPPQIQASASARPILFIDGECVLCHGLAKFILKEDKGRVLRLSTLQGETARGLLPESLIRQKETVVLHDAQGAHTHSRAIIRALRCLGGIWVIMAGVGALCPRMIRDQVYRWVAWNRYQIFGRLSSCRLPEAGDLDAGILP